MKRDKYEEVISYIIENQDKFYRLAYSYVRDKEDALDIVQNAICKALENYETLKNLDAIKTWFYRILSNESISYIRRYGKEVQYEETEELLEKSQVETYQSGTSVAVDFGTTDEMELYKEVGKLPFEIQNIIKLHYFEDMTLQEVAEVMDMNLNTVKAKLYRGLKKMKLEMGENDIWQN